MVLIFAIIAVVDGSTRRERAGRIRKRGEVAPLLPWSTWIDERERPGTLAGAETAGRRRLGEAEAVGSADPRLRGPN